MMKRLLPLAFVIMLYLCGATLAGPTTAPAPAADAQIRYLQDENADLRRILEMLRAENARLKAQLASAAAMTQQRVAAAATQAAGDRQTAEAEKTKPDLIHRTLRVGMTLDEATALLDDLEPRLTSESGDIQYFRWHLRGITNPGIDWTAAIRNGKIVSWSGPETSTYEINAQYPVGVK